MKRIKKALKYISAAFLVALTTFTVPQQVYASDAIPGSITIVMKFNLDTGETTEIEVLDGELSIFKVKDEAGNPEEEFKSFVENGNLTKQEQAKRYQDFIKKNSINPYRSKTVDHGQVVFDNIYDGTYLVMQTSDSEGYENIEPFIVKMPVVQESYTAYNLMAKPKIEKDQGYKVTIEKHVTGNMGNRAKKFSFTMVSADLADKDLELSDGTALNFDSNGNAKFELADSESIEIVKVPSGTTFEVKEDDYSSDGYITTYTNQKVEGLSEDTTVSVTNTRTVALPTGNATQFGIQLIGFGILTGVCVLKILHRKKSQK